MKHVNRYGEFRSILNYTTNQIMYFKNNFIVSYMPLQKKMAAVVKLTNAYTDNIKVGRILSHSENVQ